MPRYSIVVPVYNAERYLETCLDSIYRQSYIDFEVVLVNDGSTDSSSQICKRYREQYSNVCTTIVDQENKGLLAARRAGFKACSGEYVWTIDADDLIREDALEVIDTLCESGAFDVVLFEADRGAIPTFQLPKHCAFSANRAFLNKEELCRLWQAFCDMRVSSLCMKVVRLSVLNPVDDYENWGRLQKYEDGLQVSDVLARTNTAYYLHESLYFYRQDNDNSIVHKYFSGYYAEECNVMNHCDQIVGIGYDNATREKLKGSLRKGFLQLAFYDYRKICRLAGSYDALIELSSQPYYALAMRENNRSRIDIRLFHQFVNRRYFFAASVLASVHRLAWSAKMRLRALRA